MCDEASHQSPSPLSLGRSGSCATTADNARTARVQTTFLANDNHPLLIEYERDSVSPGEEAREAKGLANDNRYVGTDLSYQEAFPHDRRVDAQPSHPSAAVARWSSRELGHVSDGVVGMQQEAQTASLRSSAAYSAANKLLETHFDDEEPVAVSEPPAVPYYDEKTSFQHQHHHRAYASHSGLVLSNADPDSVSMNGNLNRSYPGCGDAGFEAGQPAVESMHNMSSSSSSSYLSTSSGMVSSSSTANTTANSSCSQSGPAAGRHKSYVTDMNGGGGFYQNVTGRFKTPTSANDISPASVSPTLSSSSVATVSMGSMNSPHGRVRDSDPRSSLARQAADLLHKSPKTQELEEFAAKFEGYQKQRSRRIVQPTPMLDQLTRDSQMWQSQQKQFSHGQADHQQLQHIGFPAAGKLQQLNPGRVQQHYNGQSQPQDQLHSQQTLLGHLPYVSGQQPQVDPHALTPLETNLLRLVQRTDSVSRSARASDDCSTSGRESVTTVISNSSSETIRFNNNDPHSSCETLRYSECGGEESGDQGLWRQAAASHHQFRISPQGQSGPGHQQFRISPSNGGHHGSQQFGLAQHGWRLVNQQVNHYTNLDSSRLRSPRDDVQSNFGDMGSSSVYGNGQQPHPLLKQQSESALAWSQADARPGRKFLCRSQSEAGGINDARPQGPIGQQQLQQPPFGDAMTDDCIFNGISGQLSTAGSLSHLGNSGGNRFSSSSLSAAGTATSSVIGGSSSSEHVVRRDVLGLGELSRPTPTPSPALSASSGFRPPETVSASDVPHHLQGRSPLADWNARVGQFVNDGSKYDHHAASGHKYPPHKQDGEKAAHLPGWKYRPVQMEAANAGSDAMAMAAPPRRNHGAETDAGAPTCLDYCSYCGSRHQTGTSCHSRQGSDALVEPHRLPPQVEGCQLRQPGDGKEAIHLQDVQGADVKSTLPRHSMRRKPKLPTPPCSPDLSRPPAGSICSTPSPPPPPLPDQDEEYVYSTTPLPPPPSSVINNDIAASTGDENAATKPATPRGGAAGAKQPAATPKRDSPATIAAKEAPGWQMFLGFKSSTVSFTSEEVNKLRAARDESRSRQYRRDEGRSTNGQPSSGPHQKSLSPGVGQPPHPASSEGRAADSPISSSAGAGPTEGQGSSSSRLRRTGSRGRKRVENPNRNDEANSSASSGDCNSKKRQSVEAICEAGIVKQRSSEFLTRARAPPGGGGTAAEQPGAEFMPRCRASPPAEQSSPPVSVPRGAQRSLARPQPAKRTGGVSKLAAAATADVHSAAESLDKSGSGNSESPAERSNKQQQPLHITRERSLKSITNWWKNSLESGPTPPGLSDGGGQKREDSLMLSNWISGDLSRTSTANGGTSNTSTTTATITATTATGDSSQTANGTGHHGVGQSTQQHKHSHSHSDSGISSMSGRSSCISPMSDMSCSSGSSRTSLRSSSIVSGCNIPLEEEVEGDSDGDASYADLCKELLLLSPPDSRLAGAIRSYLVPSLQVYFPEATLEFEIVTKSGGEAVDAGQQPSRQHQLGFNPDTRLPTFTSGSRRGCSSSSSFDDSRRRLFRVASQRIETQRSQQLLLKESMKSNEDVGREVLMKLSNHAQQTEMDKVKLFIDEVDKITSLIIGLTSRLVRASTTRDKFPASQQQSVERREKLTEQLDEARKLRQSIFRRSEVVFRTLNKYLPENYIQNFGAFIKEKIRLILETRQHTEVLRAEEDIIKCLKEFTSGVMII